MLELIKEYLLGEGHKVELTHPSDVARGTEECAYVSHPDSNSIETALIKLKFRGEVDVYYTGHSTHTLLDLCDPDFFTLLTDTIKNYQTYKQHLDRDRNRFGNSKHRDGRKLIREIRGI